MEEERMADVRRKRREGEKREEERERIITNTY